MSLGEHEMPLQGIGTFLKARQWTADGMYDPSRTNFVFAGMPFDGASSGRSGAALAPNAIRNASMFLTDGQHPYYGGPHTEFLIQDYGDMRLNNYTPIPALDLIEKDVMRMTASGSIPLLAGGNHLCTLGVLRAMHRRHGPLALLHFDAHCDTWEGHFGMPMGHGTFLRDVISEGVVDASSVLSIGMRSPVDVTTRDWLEAQGGYSVPMHEFGTTFDATFTRGIRNLVNAIRGRPVFLTFDIDFLDPAYAPGTGTPEAGGFSTRETLRLLDWFFQKNLNFIGMDVVEVNPMVDHAQITSLAAATMLWHFASYMTSR